MLDYKLLEALTAVVETGGFERAGQSLGLSQSAVSQRIRLLEARLGQPVLIRSGIPSLTPLGQRLLNHCQQVRLLEQDLRRRVPALGQERNRLRIAINADSVATWWAEAIGDFAVNNDLLMELVIEDQDVGLQRMRDGEVAACLCSGERPVQGARVVPLGAMIYRGLASPDYVRRYFPEGLTAAAIAQAPAVIYGPNDQLHARFLRGLDFHDPFPFHLCPSSEGFVRFAEAGLGYGFIPEIQAAKPLASGRLVDVAPEGALSVPLYWHYWRHGGALLDELTRTLMQRVPALLVMPE